jgi:hypothetical protein
MDMPNEFELVEKTVSDFQRLINENSAQSITEWMQIMGSRLANKDSRWGFLTKEPGEHHITLPSGQDIAVDAFCWKDTGQVVDVLVNAIEPGVPSRATWQPKPRRDWNKWFAIIDFVPPVDNGDNNADHTDLQRQINDLRKQFAAFMAQKPVVEGSIISLRSENTENPHPWLCADGNQENRVIANRDEANSWEQFKVKVK